MLPEEVEQDTDRMACFQHGLLSTIDGSSNWIGSMLPGRMYDHAVLKDFTSCETGRSRDPITGLPMRRRDSPPASGTISDFR